MARHHRHLRLALSSGTVDGLAVPTIARLSYLGPDANESQRGFLLNHLITEELPAGDGERRYSNSDPITGQAAWYDVRVRVYALR